MRHLVTRVLAVLVSFGLLVPLLAPPAAAAEVTAWVETATKTPGGGCGVEVSVELRSGGGPLAGAEVTVALIEDDTTNVISATSATTNDSGIAWLSMDTSAAPPGLKGWMEVAVNGGYLGGQTIWVTDGAACSGNSTLVEMSGSATTTIRGGSAPAAGANDGSKVEIPNVWTYQQQRGLSCEYSALSIATGALGNWISEYDFERVVPLHENPHVGYRGNINGTWGNTDDYGVYAAPLVPALANFGFTGNAWYGGPDELKAAIDRGEPTLVWLGMNGDLSHDAHSADGTRYQLTQYMHVMVAYGYDSAGVYLSDPGTGSYKYYGWGDFTWMWNVMDGMALSVSR